DRRLDSRFGRAGPRASALLDWRRWRAAADAHGRLGAAAIVVSAGAPRDGPLADGQRPEQPDQPPTSRENRAGESRLFQLPGHDLVLCRGCEEFSGSISDRRLIEKKLALIRPGDRRISRGGAY